MVEAGELPLDVWNQGLAVGLIGTFPCSWILGSKMVRRGKGVILNIALDLAIITPN